MIFSKLPADAKWISRGAALALSACMLAACATTVETDNAAGSRLTQPAGATPQTPEEAGDIAIAGQEAAHAILDLPEVAGATIPPLVQFAGVTSIINGPVDTEPYTNLLRDRLLLITRLKLRFIERQLPPLQPHHGHKKGASAPLDVSTDYQYQVLAELRGTYGQDQYRIQIQFVDAQTGAVLFNGLYRIRREMDDTPPAGASGYPNSGTASPGPGMNGDPGSPASVTGSVNPPQ